MQHRAVTSDGASPAPNGLLWPLALTLAAALAYFPFVYSHAFGEWDSYRVASGVINAIREGLAVGDASIRNNTVSYAYSYLLLAFRGLVDTSPTALFAVMNYANAFAATLTMLPFFFVLRRYFGETAAVAGGIALVATPVWWHTALYGHPMTFSILALLTALVAIGAYEDARRRAVTRRVLAAYGAMVIALVALTLMFRLDAVLLFPMLTAVLRLEGRGWRASFAVSIGWALAALAVFLALRGLIFSSAGLGSVMSSVALYHDVERVGTNVVRAAAIFVLSCHPLLLAAYGAGVLRLAFDRAWNALFFLVPTMAVNIVFWMPNPAPGRHFIYVAPVLAAGVGIAVALFVTRTQRDVHGAALPAAAGNGRVRLRGVGAAALLAVLTLPLAEAYLLLMQRAYPWKYGEQDYSARAPIRSMIANKSRTEHYYRSAGKIGERLADLPASSKPYLVIADPRPAQVELMMHEPSATSRMRPYDDFGREEEIPIVTTSSNTFVLLDVENDLPYRLLEIEGSLGGYEVIIDHTNPTVAYTVDRYNGHLRAELGLETTEPVSRRDSR